MQQWSMKQPIFTKDQLLYLSRVLHVHPLLIHLMSSRGLKSEEEMELFLYPDKSQLHSPWLLPDMSIAVDRILMAIARREQIAVFGDYDSDGVTSTAVLVKALRTLGANVTYRLPLRSEGYGISPLAVDDFKAQGISLIVTVDNGSTAFDALNRAKEHRIDVICTDHHRLHADGTMPPCLALVNHQRSDNTYPFPYLCGAAVAYKLVQALYEKTGRNWNKHAGEYIELTAIGTIADMMPLSGENRVLASIGISRIQSQPMAPLAHLLRALKIQPSMLTSSDIGFRIGPIFNAMGRLSDPHIVTDFLLSERVDDTVVSQLIDCNDRRKVITREQTKLAESIIASEGLSNNPILVVRGDFHEGVLGIVASRLAEQFKKPTIVLGEDGRGSARAGSESFSIIDVLTKASPYLSKYGGHKAAAGLAVDPNHLHDFGDWIQQFHIPTKEVVPEHIYDSTLSMHLFPEHIRRELLLLEPFGMNNPQPLFYSPKTPIEKMMRFGKEEEHVKFSVSGHEALLFANSGSPPPHPDASHLSFLYTPTANGKLQFMIKDVKAS